MIYVDWSVLLAQLLAEDRHPAASFRQTGSLVSSRLLGYEVWTRVHARGLGASHAEVLRVLLARLGFLGLTGPVLARALEPFPSPVRTLDALHLASMDLCVGWVSARAWPRMTADREPPRPRWTSPSSSRSPRIHRRERR